MSTLAIKIALGSGLAIGLAITAYSWHRSIVRAEQQRVEAETRSAAQAEAAAQHQAETEQYKLRISELEARIVDLAKNRAASVQRIEVITKDAATRNEEIKNLDSDGVRAAIRDRLSRPDPGPSQQ